LRLFLQYNPGEPALEQSATVGLHSSCVPSEYCLPSHPVLIQSSSPLACWQAILQNGTLKESR